MLRVLPALRRVVPSGARGLSSTRVTPRVYSYGDGYLGTLGQDNFDAVVAPTPIAPFDNVEIASLSCGWAHTGLLDVDGNAYVFGRSHHFRNVIRSINMQRMVPYFMKFVNTVGGERTVEAFRPTLVDLPAKTTAISCGAALSLYLTETGDLYSNGGNSYGQCGIGNENTSVWEPTKLKLPPVATMAAGFQHALAVTTNGQVYGWGKGERGQLGFGTVNVSAPQHIVALREKNVVEVGAGFNHSVALTDAGEVFVWGKLLGADKYGRKTGEDQITPRLVQTAAPVTHIKTSFFHTFMVTEDGQLWCMGRSQASQHAEVAQRKYPETHIAPHAIDNSFLRGRRIVHLGGGVHSTSLVTDDGKAFEWDWEQGFRAINATKDLHVLAFERGYGTNFVLAK
ncbi:hypothetical protein SPRG_06631 [Saprolegnia parasitica CBS 223.65]|uniref:Uncharacterized protein n=1 Tax=Saprolegnia parasitica (strain CBS 223.65) TaxID=695850 RepID=A0A067CD17_SAPPC|nr:hypothetical protein SPRG_06631 [Saprolegnia parasitica CBS 223.65]KDO28393.1 hypothetical protein SPRG_06631 [Saprolegnia parasitica CBS 223.65]|eukprot:XP_012200835.1 hypothetical protein SPRG_06631 [Saprolegnia parasitica CBS 223.65]